MHRFDVKTGEHAIVSNEIVFQTNCILSTAYLFNNPKDNELYAIIRYSEDNNPKAKISVYKLNAPPITYQELKKWNTDDDNEAGRAYLYYIIGGVVLLLILCFAYYRHRKKVVNKRQQHRAFQKMVYLSMRRVLMHRPVLR